MPGRVFGDGTATVETHRAMKQVPKAGNDRLSQLGRHRQIFGGFRTVLLGNGFSKACLVIFELSMARHFGVDEFGLFALGLATAFLVTNLSLFGLNFSVIQYLAKYAETGTAQLRSAVVWGSVLATTVFAGLAGGALVLSSEWLAITLFRKEALAPILVIVGAVVVFEGFNQVASAAFRGARKFRLHNLIADLIRNTVLLVAIPAIVLFELDLTYAFVAHLIGSALASFVALWWLRKEFGFFGLASLDRHILLELFSFSWMLWLWSVLQATANRSFILLSGMFLTAGEVGVLSLVLRLAMLMQFFQTAANMVAPVEYARLHYLGDKEELNRLFQSVSVILLLLCAVVAVPLLVDPERLLSVFGADYRLWAWIAWPLTLRTAVNVATGPVGQVLVNSRERGAVLAMSVVDACLQFGLVVPLMWGFGLSGAVWGEVARVAIVVVVRLAVAKRRVGLRLIHHRYVALWLVALAAGAAGAGLGTQMNGWFGFVGAAASALCLLALGSFLILQKDTEMRGFIAALARGDRQKLKRAGSL